MDMKRTQVILLLCVALLAGGCASQPVTPEARPSTTATSSTPAPSPQEKASPTPASLTGSLRRSGFAIGQRNGVILVGLEGRVLERLPGFELAGNSDNRGVWLQSGRDYFRLDPDDAALLPVARSVARARIYGGSAEVNLPVPMGARYRGRVAGRWRYVVSGPGEASLAQWSGECEVPTAFWAEGSELLVLTTGGEELGGPESIALGWGSDGRAFAHLGEGYCGGAADPPGIYAFSRPGVGRLVYRTQRGANVDMW